MLEKGTRFDKYTIVRRLGEGGMGMVYLATNQFGVDVVLKMLHPQLVNDADVVERFRREGRIQYTLRHPNIVRVTDIVEDHGLPALVVDYMRGRDLEEHLVLEGPLSPEDTIKISTRMLDALQLAHSHGFFHRDLKPSNIFLEESGASFEPRLMDFGIAKIEEAAALTRAQEFCGTPAFASPEQIASTKDVDHMTDIYSFGVVIWSMCTGVEPYRDIGDDPYAVLAMVVREQLPPLPDTVPGWLRKVVAKATQKDPADRFQSALEFRDAIVSAAAASQSYAETVVDFSEMLGANSVLGVEETFDQVPSDAETAELIGGDGRPEAAGGPLPGARGTESGATLAGGFEPPAGFDTMAGSGPGDVGGDPLREMADLTGSDPDRVEEQNRVAESMGSNYQATRGVDMSGRIVHEPKRRDASASLSAPSLPHGDGVATRLELDRARRVEESFRSRPSPMPTRVNRRVVGAVAVGAVVAVLGGGAAYLLSRSQPEAAPDGFVRIEPTTFTMGSPESEPGRSDDERRFEATITRPYAMQTAEVTQAGWVDLMYSEPDSFEDCGPDCPITNVSWVDAARFANRYSIDAGLPPCYEIDASGVRWPEGLDCEGFRLPTEAEWEFAARAGSQTAFFNGDLRNTGRSLLDPRLTLVGWYGANSDVDYHDSVDCSTWGEGRDTCGPQPVRTRRANGWGIYDMHGNVAEWVWDRYGSYPAESAIDPIGPTSGAQRVVRGGSWRDTAESCRSADRARSPSNERNHIGFRLAKTLR